MLELIDTHSHFDVAEFDGDRDAALARAHAAGVTRQIVPAIALGGFEKLRALCAAKPGLFPAYGLHPLFLAEHRPEHLDALGDWLARERPVAIGECGLDYYAPDLDREVQQRYLDRQLELARDLELPVVLHARRAFDAVTASVRRAGVKSGVVHSFSGSAEQAQQIWKLGLHIGIGGPVTYPRAKRLREIVATMPIDRLLLETDSPDQPLCGHQGHRNEPAKLFDVLRAVAELRGESEEAVAAATTRNAVELFALSPRRP